MSIFRETCDDKLIDNIILFLIFQPNVTTDEYTFCFEALHEYAMEKDLSDYFILLGDLLDANIYGTPSIYTFERRLNFYIRSGDISRQISILMLMHQKVNDKSLKQQIESQIFEMMESKTRYSISDFRLLITYSCMGVSKLLTPAFKHFDFAEVVSSDNLLSKELVRLYDELGAEVKVTSINARTLARTMTKQSMLKLTTDG
jgi:hypothetical protein